MIIIIYIINLHVRERSIKRIHECEVIITFKDKKYVIIPRWGELLLLLLLLLLFNIVFANNCRYSKHYYYYNSFHTRYYCFLHARN